MKKVFESAAVMAPSVQVPRSRSRSEPGILPSVEPPRSRAIPESDPLWQAILRAPVDDSPVPEVERLAVEEAERSGRFVDDDDLEAVLEARCPQ